MKTNYSASMDTLTKVLTAIVLIVMVVIPLFVLYPMMLDPIHTSKFWTSIIVYPLCVVALLICYLFRVIRYEINPEELIIIRPINSVHIPLATIKGITLIDADDLIGTIRVGNGGFFGYTGFYWNRTFKWMRFYLTQRKNIILIEQTPKEGKEKGIKLLISPDDANLDGRLIEILKAIHKS